MSKSNKEAKNREAALARREKNEDTALLELKVMVEKQMKKTCVADEYLGKNNYRKPAYDTRTNFGMITSFFRSLASLPRLLLIVKLLVGRTLFVALRLAFRFFFATFFFSFVLIILYVPSLFFNILKVFLLSTHAT